LCHVIDVVDRHFIHGCGFFQTEVRLFTAMSYSPKLLRLTLC
jgi:hypothetical protein